MTPRRRRILSPLEQLVVWAVLALLLYLDRDGCVLSTRADVFSWVLGALGFLEDAATFIISGVEMTISAAVTWLVSAVAWLGGKIADVVVSTGSIFSKTWDALQGLWSDVIKPAISWLTDIVTRFARWLNQFIQPLLSWARAVRDELLALYRTFVAPILRVLNIAKAILDILAKLHVPFAAALDQYVTELESWITQAFLKVLGEVNKVIDTINGLFTFDGLLQRFVVIRSIQRDMFYLQRAFYNPMVKGLDDTQQARLNAAWKPQTAPEISDALGSYLDGESNDTGDTIDAAVANANDLWDSLSGLGAV